jgi:coenzyme F420-0:L-glutamate ligase/coenzyme F420-1:gamma-L-glutamate ligase
VSQSAVTIAPLEHLPAVRPGDDLAALLVAALDHAGVVPQRQDVLVVTQKIVSKAENRYLDLDTVTPSPRARELAEIVLKDARLVEAVLSQSVEVLRARPNVLIGETKQGLVMANAGIDQSNLAESDHGRRVLLLPEDADATAARLKASIESHYGVEQIGLIISDSVGRAWRLGTVGLAIGAAGVPSLWDRRGEPDLSGRRLEVTEVGFADAAAAAAVLVMGEGAEGRPAVLMRGLRWTAPEGPARALVRPKKIDLFR